MARLLKYGWIGLSAGFVVLYAIGVAWFGFHIDSGHAIEIILVSLLGPAIIWIVSGWVERLAKEAEARQLQLRSLGSMVQQVLEERGELAGDIDEAKRHLALLARVNQAVLTPRHSQGVPEDVLDATLEVLRLDAGEMWLPEPDGRHLFLYRHRGISPQAFQQITRFPLGEGFPGIAAETKSFVFTNDLADEKRFLRPAVIQSGFLSFAAFPVLDQDSSVVGVLTVASRRGHRFSDAQGAGFIGVHRGGEGPGADHPKLPSGEWTTRERRAGTPVPDQVAAWRRDRRLVGLFPARVATSHTCWCCCPDVGEDRSIRSVRAKGGGGLDTATS